MKEGAATSKDVCTSVHRVDGTFVLRMAPLFSVRQDPMVLGASDSRLPRLGRRNRQGGQAIGSGTRRPDRRGFQIMVARPRWNAFAGGVSIASASLTQKIDGLLLRGVYTIAGPA